jgi:hypothetical protein
MSRPIIHGPDPIHLDGRNGQRYWVHHPFEFTGEKETDTALSSFPVAVFQPHNRTPIRDTLLIAFRNEIDTRKYLYQIAADLLGEQSHQIQTYLLDYAERFRKTVSAIRPIELELPMRQHQLSGDPTDPIQSDSYLLRANKSNCDRLANILWWKGSTPLSVATIKSILVVSTGFTNDKQFSSELINYKHVIALSRSATIEENRLSLKKKNKKTKTALLVLILIIIVLLLIIWRHLTSF